MLMEKRTTTPRAAGESNSCCGSIPTCFSSYRRLSKQTARSRRPRASSDKRCLTSTPKRLQPSSDKPSFSTIIECYQPLLYEIASFLNHRPHEFVQFSNVTAQFLTDEGRSALLSLWEVSFARSWPALYECMKFNGETDWYEQYKEVFLGRAECTLEVFEREKKVGFAMSALAARVRFERGVDGEGCYVARYLSVNKALPERIPLCEETRLRFCPASARAQLLTVESCAEEPEVGFISFFSKFFSNLGGFDTETQSDYPYKVLEGTHGLHVGQGVELQWKMQSGSPFGWWYARLEALEHDADRRRATATITFPHFSTTSEWYRLRVQFGDGDTRPCTFGGYTGGLLAVASDTEEKRWMQFLQKAKVCSAQ